MPKLFVAYLLLFLAIVFEVVGTTLLQKSQQFTRFWPSAGVLVCYVVSFVLLSHVLKYIPLGIAYAIWAGVGIILTAVVSVLLFRQSLDLGAIIGIALIISGVVVTNLFSRSLMH